MALQVFTAGQTLTAAQMTTLQASTYNYPLSTISTSTYTILSSDAGKLLVFTNNASPVGVTFPASLGMAVGDTVEIVHTGTGTLTLIADAGVTLNSEGSLLTLGTRYARVAVVKTASNVFLVSWMTAITEAEITTGSVTSDKIANDTIVNADINTSAAIAHSKLANATAGQVLLGTTTTGVVTATTISGDVTINGAGVATIAANSVALGTDTTGNYVATVSGTANQVTISGSGAESAAVTVSLPQDIATTSNPTFAGVTADLVQVGVTSAGEIDTSSGNLTIDSAGGTTTIDDNLTITGTVTGNPAAGTTSTGTSGFGYMGLPQNATTTGAYTVLAADAGKHIYSTATRTITIPANATTAMPVGSTLVFIAGSGATVTIAITTDTLYLAGLGTTGSRTLAAFGMATAVKITATSWIISGNGLS